MVVVGWPASLCGDLCSGSYRGGIGEASGCVCGELSEVLCCGRGGFGLRGVDSVFELVVVLRGFPRGELSAKSAANPT